MDVFLVIILALASSLFEENLEPSILRNRPMRIKVLPIGQSILSYGINSFSKL